MESPIRQQNVPVDAVDFSGRVRLSAKVRELPGTFVIPIPTMWPPR